MPTVSIIVPVYNAEKYVETCVRSILGQSCHDIEVILVDDGSTDGSWNICRRMMQTDDRVKAFHQENVGVSAARNTGMAQASGDYLAFVDSDDTLTEHAVQLLVDDAQMYGADIVSAVKCNVDEQGKVYNPHEDGTLTVYRDLEPLHLCLHRDKQTNSVCAKLFRRDYISDIRFEKGRNINEDGFFIFCCYAKRPLLVQHNICIYRYLSQANSASHGAFSEKYLDMLYFCDKKKELLRKRYPELMAAFVSVEVGTHLLFLDVLLRTDDRKYKPYERKCVRVIRQNHKAFVPYSAHEKKMVVLVRLGLYPIAKTLYRMKNRNI